jgi:hypothetical protein
MFAPLTVWAALLKSWIAEFGTSIRVSPEKCCRHCSMIHRGSQKGSLQLMLQHVVALTKKKKKKKSR